MHSLKILWVAIAFPLSLSAQVDSSDWWTKAPPAPVVSFDESSSNQSNTKSYEMDEKPYFFGCGHLIDTVAKRECSNKELTAFFDKNLKYPALANDYDIEGTVWVHFFIDEEGNVVETQLIREPGGGCGEEALRLVRLMPKWTPAKYKGKPVKSPFFLSIKFNLRSRRCVSLKRLFRKK